MNTRKFITIISVLTISALMAVGQVLDLQSLNQWELIKGSNRHKVKSAEEKYYPSIVKLREGETVESLEQLGARIMRQRGNLVLAFIPTDKIELLQTNSGINRLSLNSRSFTTMDKARPFAGASRLIEPGGMDGSPWTGKGVVVGMTDIGFDPHHPNFIAPDGQMRVKRIVNYQDTLAVVTRMYEPSEVASWVTDDSDHWHGTHVMGILAGSCHATPYYGIASEADIMATTSILTDACLLDGIEEIIDYAKAQGKPAVINMSVGSYTGPHDGTTLFNQYIDQLGKEAIICMSAGNEAISTNCLQADFTDELTSNRIFVTDRHHYDAVHNYGLVDIWSADNRPFNVALSIYDLKTYKIIAEYPLVGATPGMWEIASPGRGGETAVSDAMFDECYDGYFRVLSEEDPENGRYRVLCSMDVKCRDKVGVVGRYFVTLTIQGDPGVHVDAYADGSNLYFTSGGRRDFFQPNPDQSVSDIACGHNVIVVGASSSRNAVPQLGGDDLVFGFNEGWAADFSSYGTLVDGRVLPHITAPGNYVVSSVSTPFVEAHPEMIPQLSAEAVVDGRKAWWIAECGTSMSAPYMAGVVATWLQADPTLDVETIRSIAISTATHTAPDSFDPRWGRGALDAEAGMRAILQTTGFQLPACCDMSPAVTVKNGVISVTSPASADFKVEIFTMDGVKVAERQGQDYAIDIPADSYAPGVYSVSVSAPRSTPRVVKIALR